MSSTIPNEVDDFYPFTDEETETMRLERKSRILAGGKVKTRYNESSRAKEASKKYLKNND